MERLPASVRNWMITVALACGILCLCGGRPGIAVAQEQAPSSTDRRFPVKPSFETTRLTGPVLPDGTIDYLGAIIQPLKEGVTHENNAAVCLLRAFGPEYVDEPIRQGVLADLGLESLPIEGAYFVSLEDIQESVTPEERQSAPEMTLKLLAEPWRAGQYPHPLLADWVRKNRQPLKWIEAAAERSRFCLPLFPPDNLNDVPEFNGKHTLGCLGQSSALLLARASISVSEGQWEKAAADVLRVHRLARLLSRHKYMYAWVVANYLDVLAARADARLILSGIGNLQQLKKHQDALKDLSKRPSPADCIDTVERYGGLALMMWAWRCGTGTRLLEGLTDAPPEYVPSYRTNWGESLRGLNEWYDVLVAAHRDTDPRRRQEGVKRLMEEMDVIVTRGYAWLHPEFIKAEAERQASEGADTEQARLLAITANELKILIACLETVFDYATEVHEIEQVRRDLAIAACALARFKLIRGRYPKSLNELGPKWLAAAPMDRFSGKPLKYRRTDDGFVLYSVGMNLRDDGGVATASWAGIDGWKEGDVVVQEGPQSRKPVPATDLIQDGNTVDSGSVDVKFGE